jgi:hypothetical protein
MRIFHQPHQNRQRENEFVQFLAGHFSGRFCGPIVNAPYGFHAAALNYLVSTRYLVAALESDLCLHQSKRQQCIDLLRALPAQIRVALAASRISIDVVVEQDRQQYCWEFHEEQHRELTINRPCLVYGPNGEEMRVPRFLQRLIRDVWRVLALPAVTIVWCDWFDQHRDSYDPVLHSGFCEYSLPGLFSLKAIRRDYLAAQNCAMHHWQWR